MKDNYPQIQELLHQRADYQARLNLFPYDGSPEIKESGGKQYLYISGTKPETNGWLTPKPLMWSSASLP